LGDRGARRTSSTFGKVRRPFTPPSPPSAAPSGVADRSAGCRRAGPVLHRAGALTLHCGANHRPVFVGRRGGPWVRPRRCGSRPDRRRVRCRRWARSPMPRRREFQARSHGWPVPPFLDDWCRTPRCGSAGQCRPAADYRPGTRGPRLASGMHCRGWWRGVTAGCGCRCGSLPGESEEDAAGVSPMGACAALCGMVIVGKEFGSAPGPPLTSGMERWNVPAPPPLPPVIFHDRRHVPYACSGRRVVEWP
jgi:hypothetical protein